MIKKLIFTLLIVSSWLFCANGQINKAAQSSLNNRIQNKVLGISFSEVGKVSQVDSSTYNIDLSSSDNLSNQSATAQISVVNRLYVDLPGSYGGRLYLDSPAAAKLIKNKLLVDSVDNGQQIFKRQYWAVYGGMGMWDCVINCYTYANGKYYIVSLVQDKMMGKPGEIDNGKQVTSNELKMKIVSSMKDTTNTTVKKFYNLLSSFQVTN
jgi:hypothetical protein